MAQQVQFRRGTTTDISTFVGVEGEVVVDTTKDVLVVMDGVTAGGFPVAARANADGTVSILGKDGTLLSSFSSSTKLAEYTPVPYPKNTPPTGYLMLMGQSISSSTYPILYSLYGETLPDMRAMTIRGWDNGRGIDSGRSILSYQADTIKSHSHNIWFGTDPNNVRSPAIDSTITPSPQQVTNPTLGGVGQIQSTGDVETRVKNIAFNYIVKAG